MAVVTQQKRQKAEGFGRIAETICALVLRCKGYRILEIRHRNAGGEIDIVAKTRATLALVEVKARRKSAYDLELITPHKRRRIEQAAAILLAQPRYALLASQPNMSIRFDVMIVRGWRWPTHIKDAWRMNG